MESNNRKRNLDDILSAAERIIKAREEEIQEDLSAILLVTKY